MKKIILISLLPILVLAGCTQQPSQDDLFTKKQDCVSYKEEMDKDIQSAGYEDFIIQDIFYSPSLNSCLYQFNTNKEFLILVDFFSKRTILTYAISYDPTDKTTGQRYDEFISKIQQLKK